MRMFLFILPADKKLSLRVICVKKRDMRYSVGLLNSCRALVDLLFPRHCIICGENLLLNEKHLCLGCLAEMPLTYSWRFIENPGFKAFYGRVYIERFFSLIYYTQSYKSLLHSIKYYDNIKLGLWMGEMLGEKISGALAEENQQIDYVVPVPLHWRKQWKRGYNQSEIIAKGIVKGITKGIFKGVSENLSGESLSGQNRNSMQRKPPKILTNILQRAHFTQTQTHKDRIDRWKSVEGAFRLNHKAIKKYNWDGKHILLVDDVLTTGATLDACANLLIKRCCCRVSIATLAYVE